MLPPLGLSFADATSVAVQAGAPVTFGAFNVGAGSAGGSSTTDNDTAAPKGDSTAVTPVTSMNWQDQLANLAGEGTTDILGQGLQTAGQFLGNSGFGTNAAYVQTLPGVSQPKQGLSNQAKADVAPSAMPGPIALGGIALLGAVAVFLMVR